MLNFDQVGYRNLDKLPTNSVNWVLKLCCSTCSILDHFAGFTLIEFLQIWATLIQFGQFWDSSLEFGSSCLVLINWVHVTTINFATFW